MKKPIATLCLLISFFTSGCDDTSANKQVTDNPQIIPITQKQMTVEANKQFALNEQPKQVVKKKPVKSESDTVELADQTQEQQVLDLSVPLEINNKTNSNKLLKNKQQSYLPDLFEKRKDKETNSMEVVGKVIKTKEEEVDKETAVDGLGIGINLNP